MADDASGNGGVERFGGAESWYGEEAGDMALCRGADAAAFAANDNDSVWEGGLLMKVVTGQIAAENGDA